jgi:hypothetical protein
MNQSNAKLLTMTADEARNLHTEIYNLLTFLTTLATEAKNSNETVTIQVDGGRFK